MIGGWVHRDEPRARSSYRDALEVVGRREIKSFIMNILNKPGVENTLFFLMHMHEGSLGAQISQRSADLIASREESSTLIFNWVC